MSLRSWSLIRPLLKVEEVAEELEGFGLVEQLQAKRTAEMSFKERRRLLKLGEHPGCIDGVLLGLALEGFAFDGSSVRHQ